MPRSKSGPPAPNPSSITSFFQRIDQAHQSFEQKGKKEESLTSRCQSISRDVPTEQREGQLSLNANPSNQFEAPSNGMSLLDTILREPLRDDRSVIPQRWAHNVLAGPRTNDGLTAAPTESTSGISTDAAAVAAKRPRRALTSSFSADDVSTSNKKAKPKQKPIRNIVHALTNRSLTGELRSSLSPMSGTLWRRKMNWCSISKLRIPIKTPNSSNTVTALAFDHEGSLLAVAHGRAELSIYDWQSIRLTTLRKTRDTGEDADCFPIMQVKVGPFSVPIALLAWNPFNEDEIAVGLR